MVVVRRDATLCVITEKGYGKRTPVSDYPVQKRGGMGTITMDVSDRTGRIVGAKELVDGDELMIIAADGIATRVVTDAVPVQGRATQGKRLVPSEGDSRVVEISRVAREQEGSAAGQSGASAQSAPSAAETEKGQLELMRDRS
jgi:DNA gyrase subunit A